MVTPMMMHRADPRGRRGFAMLVVMFLLTMLALVVTMAIEQMQNGLREGGSLRAKELTTTALETALDQAMGTIETIDPYKLSDPNNYINWDIFNGPHPSPANDFVPSLPAYPPVGPYAGTIEVRVGLRKGQRTRPPEGEDATNAYGQVFEVQLSARNGPPGFARPRRQRCGGARHGGASDALDAGSHQLTDALSGRRDPSGHVRQEPGS
jgi:hypothetical protein